MTSTEIKLSKALENGIEFSCQMCGSCCRGFKEGEVYLYQDDIERLTKRLKIKGTAELKEFARKYLKVVNDSFFWKKPGAERGKTYRFKSLGFKFTGSDEHCHFLIDNECTVHDARPFQCRAFPIGWNMLINSAKNFKDYSKKCPALQNSLESKGKFYSREEIILWANREYEMEKQYFFEMRRKDFNIFKVYPFLSKDMLCE